MAPDLGSQMLGQLGGPVLTHLQAYLGPKWDQRVGEHCLQSISHKPDAYRSGSSEYFVWTPHHSPLKSAAAM